MWVLRDVSCSSGHLKETESDWIGGEHVEKLLGDETRHSVVAKTRDEDAS